MNAAWPRYLLIPDAVATPKADTAWRFVLHRVATGETLTASDTEPHASRERNELLALVRGLEAIGQPARVTLITRSRYLRRGLERGLRAWRANNWKWERFGRLVEVRDHDLWQRADHALRFHRVEGQDYSQECSEPSPIEAPSLASPSEVEFEEPVLMVVRSRGKQIRLASSQHSAAMPVATAG